jgi:hypothetical protein
LSLIIKPTLPEILAVKSENDRGRVPESFVLVSDRNVSATN